LTVNISASFWLTVTLNQPKNPVFPLLSCGALKNHIRGLWRTG